MPKVSSKRQITIPIEQCNEAHIKPVDTVETFIYNNQITIAKKTLGAAKGLLSYIKYNNKITDEQSLQDTHESRH
ncbi:MAG: bifunctional DNA-binding transcriptional regulator [Polaribacter sp.]|jgi:bifunctional DNA-binding transcriptional regulator/antitoxin component of YhaV-PrlF toxin-antitoxin module